LPKRILIIDAGPGVAQALAKAGELGYRAEVVSVEDHEMPSAVDGFARDVKALKKVAGEDRIDGILQPFNWRSVLTAGVTHHLKLPGMDPMPTATARWRPGVLSLMEKKGLPAVPARLAKTPEGAEQAARKLGLPVWVASDDCYSSAAVVQVDQIEDVSLAYSRVTRQSELKTAVVMPVTKGPTFYVDGVMIDAVFHPCGLIGVDMGDPPFRFERGLVIPPAECNSWYGAIVNAAVQALRMLDTQDLLMHGKAAPMWRAQELHDCGFGFRDGCVHVELVLTESGPAVMGVYGCPAAMRFPIDIVQLSSGIDTLANALRFAVGDPLQMEPTMNRGVALCWIPTRSGIVTEIRGVEEAHNVPGVQEIVIVAKPGDVMGHVVDCESRDRVGYVVATGENGEAAVTAAQRAKALCEIVTKPAYS